MNELGFYTDSGPYYFGDKIEEESVYKIKSSHLFIGFLMHPSSRSNALKRGNQRVITEWEFAISRKVPAILLVEKSVKLKLPISNSPNILYFDKNNPKPAIELAHQAMENAQNIVKSDKTNAVAWLIGGHAVIALIGFLANAVQREKALAA